jgi:hypothetical protein
MASVARMSDSEIRKQSPGLPPHIAVAHAGYLLAPFEIGEWPLFPE